ncbi:N-acetylmuramoyl-L-alanine amidase, partial [Anaerostipes hadrus]
MDLVVIDSGHGGSDPGKVGINEVLEKDINLKISKQVEKELKNKGYQVVMTREKDQMLAGETSGNSKIQDMK